MISLYTATVAASGSSSCRSSASIKEYLANFGMAPRNQPLLSAFMIVVCSQLGQQRREGVTYLNSAYPR
jgi:hypothetical protein